MCSLHLTHPSAHTPGAVGSRHYSLSHSHTHTHTHTHSLTHSLSHTHSHALSLSLSHSHTHTHTHTHTLSLSHTRTHAHTHTHTRARWFLRFTGTLHRRNGLYTVQKQTVCVIALHLNLALTGDSHFYFPPHSV